METDGLFLFEAGDKMRISNSYGIQVSFDNLRSNKKMTMFVQSSKIGGSFMQYLNS